MKIPESVTRAVAKQLLVARKHSPHILFGAGVAGVITSTVMACKATLKLSDKLDYFKGEIESCKSEYYNPTILSHKEYTQAQNRRDLAYIYARNLTEIVKLYGPAAIVGAASIAALTGSHVTMARRNAALAAAYTTLSEAVQAYRARVREEVGEQKELELYHNATLAVDKKTGEAVMRLTDPSKKLSPYSRWFESDNPNWYQTAEENRYFINMQQLFLNDTLMARGHVFLNEVYDALGLSHTQEGAIVGWMWPARKGCDGHIDCGIYASRQEWHVGNEYSILLDFNVDPGVIWNKIP